MRRDELTRYLDGLLEVSRFRDYCPNGLQVEERGEIRRIVSGATASVDLIQAALTDGADAIVVHHGYFWKGDDPCLTGVRRALRPRAPVHRHSQSGMKPVPVRIRAESFSSFISTC